MSRKYFMLRLIFVLCCAALVFSCSSSSEGDNRSLPQATGKSGDLIIIMDSLQWKGELGEAVRSIFTQEVDGLPRQEFTFNVIWVHPNKKIRLLTQIRNLVYVFALDQASAGTRVITENLSSETLTNIKTDTSFYLVNKKNEYTKGQEVLYLFGNTTAQLTHHLKRDGKRIQDFFNKAERERMMASLIKTTSTKNHTAQLEKNFGVSLHFPAGFKLAQEEKNFVWFRSPEAEIDKNFFVARQPYTSEYQLLPDSILAWREKICKTYIFEDPENSQSYITTERDIPFKPVKAKQISLNGSFAMELRGLWRTNTKTMGGAFVCYAFVNETDHHLYYLEGFVYAPGKPQRELIREMEAIAHTFKAAKPQTPVQ